MDDFDDLIETLLASEPETEKFANAVASLATLSREEENVRTRLSSENVLKTLLKVLASRPKSDDLLTTTLRCVGNACASNPQACQTVTGFKFGWCEPLMVQRFVRGSDGQDWPQPSQDIRNLTFKVLYNICSQSESAQKQCYHDNVHSPLLRILASSSRPMDDLNLIVDLLFWITTHHKELAAFEGKTERKRMLEKDQVLDPAAFIPLVVSPCALQNDLDIEDWASLLEVVLVFVRDPAGYKQTITEDAVRIIWRILGINERKVQEVEGNADDQKLLVALSTSLTWALSDVAATPLLAVNYRKSPASHANLISTSVGTMREHAPMIHQLIEDLPLFLSSGKTDTNTVDGEVSNLTDSDSLRLTTAACQVIGNLLHNLLPIENTIPPKIREQHIHERLFALMASSDNADFLHSAAGLLIQLSRPSPEIREEIASDSNALPALRRLGQHTMSELNQDALKLMRALGKDTPSVQERFKELAGEVMATVAETQQAAANAQSEQPSLTATS